MKISDLQLARLIVPQFSPSLLDTELEIKFIGEKDTVVNRGNKIIYTNPSSVSRFLYQTLYSLISPCVQKDHKKDCLSVALLSACNDYVHKEEDNDSRPVFASFSKLMIPHFVISEVLAPVIGEYLPQTVAFMKCNFTDTCRICDSNHTFCNEYQLPDNSCSPGYFPTLVSNLNINNAPATDFGLIIKYLELHKSKEKTKEVIKKILSECNSLVLNLIESLYSLTGKEEYVLSFLEHLYAYAELSEQENCEIQKIKITILANSKHIKKAQYVNQDVSNQWSQFSVLIGLIEKQLGPMRGAMWPTSEALKPIEDDKKRKVQQEAKKKKKQLTIEEMLEVARDYYNHNAVEPGKLIDKFLGDVRVW